LNVIYQSDLDDLVERCTASWNSKVREQLAVFHAPDGSIIINQGEPSRRHSGVIEMAAGFHAGVPNLDLSYDGIRDAGSHVMKLWTINVSQLAQHWSTAFVM